ncbi:hypothetical protein [Virgibacillus halodenitrificans]|uniref:hypothetical protein n=1 Tax=Virgibacillus halodenitrificans TaxID=1482 RepID=UPI000EF545A7|nr:hypothetical protein [Virgibacillus halodenitrificans]
MRILKQLPNDICISIQTFFHNKLFFNVKNSFLDKNIAKENEPFLQWYINWISFISYEEKKTWKKVKKYKNNLPFINLVFKEFEKEINHHFQLQEKPVDSSQLQNYYQYANELSVEAYGVELQKEIYQKSELINIIKDCEMVLKSNLLNHKRPPHNIVPLR